MTRKLGGCRNRHQTPSPFSTTCWVRNMQRTELLTSYIQAGTTHATSGLGEFLLALSGQYHFSFLVSLPSSFLLPDYSFIFSSSPFPNPLLHPSFIPSFPYTILPLALSSLFTPPSLFFLPLDNASPSKWAAFLPFCVLYEIYEIQLKIIFYICNISTWLIAFSEKLTLDNFLGSFSVRFIKAPDHPSSQNLAGYVYK